MVCSDSTATLIKNRRRDVLVNEDYDELTNRKIKAMGWEIFRAKQHLEEANEIAGELEVYGSPGAEHEISEAIEEVEKLIDHYGDGS